MEGYGTEILSCGTCLDFFGKRERLVAGRVTNMHDTVETLVGPFRVVTIGWRRGMAKWRTVASSRRQAAR